MKFFILSIEHEKNKIYILSRDENWNRCIIEASQPYYVYVIPKEEYFDEILSVIKGIKYVKEYNIEEKYFIGKLYKVIKVFFDEENYENFKEIIDKLKEEGKVVGKKEADIPITKKFEIDNNIYPMNWYELDVEEVQSTKDIKYYKLKGVKGILNDKFNLKVVVIDIETMSPRYAPDPSVDSIKLIGIYDGNNYYSLFWGEESGNGMKFKNEYEMLVEFNKLIKNLDPDVIVGYNSNNFDLYFLYERAKKLNVEFNFGWDGSGIMMSKKREEDKKYKFFGIQHIDLYEFIVNLFSGQLRSETYTLDEVAKEILGYGKIEMNEEKLEEMKLKGNLQELIDYNKRDLEITYKLYKYYENIIIEISRVVGMNLYEVSNSTYGILVENYLIKKAREYNQIIPNRPKPEEVEERRRYSYPGAFVLEPKPGLYKNIMVLDFRSLYPSIIIRYNVSLDKLKCNHEECKENGIEIETSLGKSYVWFCKKEKGFISSVLENIFKERTELKKKLKTLNPGSEEYKEIDAKQYALKILSNSIYGYYAFIQSRWYCLECAAAITAFGRRHIREVIEKTKEKGFEAIYGDTDSVFILVKSKEDGLKFLEEINNSLPKPIELELEDFYVSGIFVPKRSEEKGAKKKYALLSESGNIKLRGFEVVRRDWSPIAKEVQENTIKLALMGDKSKIISYLREVINNIKAKKYPIEYFIIREQLRKDTKEYEVMAPHVVAAKKYEKLGYKVRKGFIVEYIICKGGNKVSDKVKLLQECKNNEYDEEYYIDKQVFPAIESILKALGITREQIISGQRDIFSYFK